MSPDNTAALSWLVIGIILLIVHFIPSIVAFNRDHKSQGLILIFNIFFGWTVIGWVILLIWANEN